MAHAFRSLCLVVALAAPGIAYSAPINFALAGTATASSTYDATTGPERAIDDLAATLWNAGNLPVQWIEVDLGASLAISEIQGLVAQSPNGNTTHDVSLDGVFAFTWSGFTADADLLSQVFGSPVSAQVVRITTTSSPSWVAWREVRVLGEPAVAAVPEPATLMLLATGLGSIAFSRRRKAARLNDPNSQV